jgi:hypothetical protein
MRQLTKIVYNEQVAPSAWSSARPAQVAARVAREAMQSKGKL